MLLSPHLLSITDLHPFISPRMLSSALSVCLLCLFSWLLGALQHSWLDFKEDWAVSCVRGVLISGKSYDRGWDVCCQVNVLCVIKVTLGHVSSEAGAFWCRNITLPFFRAVLISWLNRFWPQVVWPSNFSSAFSSQRWVLFSVSLCLWVTHVHHISKDCQIAMACFPQTSSSPGHPEMPSWSHLNDLCPTHMQTTMRYIHRIK